jgi:hypothetical protein
VTPEALAAAAAPQQPAAQDESARDQASDAADEANTPLPRRTQIQFQPSYTFANGDTRYKAELLFQPLLPYRAFFIPGLEANDFWSIARVRLFAESVQNANGPASGLTDLTFTDLVAHKLGPFNAALGFCSVFPMATATALGQGKLQFGPAAGLRLEGISSVKIAVLVQDFYSVAGSSQSPDVAYLTVQPFITVHLPAALFFSSDAQMTFYQYGGQSTVPVNLGFGHAFGGHFAGSIRGYYTVADSDRGAIKAEVVLDFEP